MRIYYRFYKGLTYMELQRLLSYVRKAVDDYSLIDEGDKIAVGISGGKDSLTLLYALNALKRFYPNHFEVCAVTVDLVYGASEEGFCIFKHILLDVILRMSYRIYVERLVLNHGLHG